MAEVDEEEEYYGEYGEEMGRYEHMDLGAEGLEEESILTEYDPDDFVSTACVSDKSSIPIDLFEFEYSYGYDCLKYFNICPCDDSVVCWSAGSIITFMDVNTKQTWFRRSTTGGTIGNITSYRKDPNYRIAVAEASEGSHEPLIILYTWPQMEIDAVLREGTENAYANMDFSPDGELLASVGKEPDYNLTIWNWKRHKILLRTSAFTYNVNNVMFSPYCDGQLTTAGLAHIKFWKMVLTFTGLKLKGELGRFGKTEICDVLGIFPMPDEKVLSGCEWGNILVWEAGLVKLEVTQRGRKPCHGAPIIQFMLSPAGDEVTTISRDGYIRAWYWDTVEQADPPEDDQYVELNPVAETCVPGCQILALQHQVGSYWYAQDGNGGIWVVELELDKIECNHRKVLTTHAGPVVSIIALRTHPIIITAGEDGCIMAYHSQTHKLLARYTFPAAVTYMLYAPLAIDATSRTILVGFSDGIMRVLLVHPKRLIEQKEVVDISVHSVLTIHSEDSVNADVIDLILWLKPHSKKIKQISINKQNTLLVTCGEDSTIFMYKLVIVAHSFTLDRLGYIETPNNIAYMAWKPDKERMLLLCGQVGLVMEAVLPEVEVRNYSEITTFRLEFESYKETLVKKQYMRHRPFPEEEDLASLDEEALKAAAEMGAEEEDEQEWVGEIELIESESQLGTTVTWAEYCKDGVWIVQRGTGALLLIVPGINKILKYAPFPDAWCEDLCTLRFVCDDRYLVVGTNTGYIRVVRMPFDYEDDPDTHYVKWMNALNKLLKKLRGRRLAKEEKQPTPRIDFVDYYYLQMHDRYTGAVMCLDFSADGKYFFTCGGDGNIFSYIINFEEPLLPTPDMPEAGDFHKVVKVKEPSTLEGIIMSHEQLKQKEEYDKMMAIANAHKKRVRDQLAELTGEYNKMIRANRLLPASQQIDVTLDPRPLMVQEKELDELRALAIRKVAHQLEASDLALWKMHSRYIIMLDVFPFTLTAIRDTKVQLRPLRQKNLSKAFYSQLEEVHQKMAEAALRGRKTEAAARRMMVKRASWGPPRVASFLLGLPPKPPHPLKKALRNYYQRLNRHHIQLIEWQEHQCRKPDPNALPPGAAEALKEAEATIGNRLLKTHPDYVAPPGHNTQLRICLTRQEIYENKRQFNAKVTGLRDHKVRLVERIKAIGERLAEIRIEIPPKEVKHAPLVPTIDENLEFPEKNLQVNIPDEEIKPEIIQVPVRPTGPTGKRMSIAVPIQEKRKSYVFPQARYRQPRVARFIPLSESRPSAASWEILKPRPDYESTPMEIEIRQRRIHRNLYEQDMLLAESEVLIQQFDSRLRQLQRERIRVQERNQLLELHLYQLHQEMNVLNRFEAHEDRLAEKVYVKLLQVKAVQEQINDCEQRIEEHEDEKEEIDLKCQDIQRDFKRLVADNKFADFLRRIFKKKYRPPRTETDDESSESESSSSSSEDDDEGSLDSRDIGPIRLDPNICPDGCDQELYEKTYSMRNTRHQLEQQMLEQDRLVEIMRKDIDAHNKVKRKLSVQLDKRKRDLREFMLEKQSCLNEIDQVVVLRYEQIRAAALKGCTGPEGLTNAVVFPEQLLFRLRKRVIELQEEIKQQRLRAKINRTHLFRMNIDLREMERLAEEIRAQMHDVLTRKLGKPRKVDRTLDDSLRQMARRHKYSLNLKIMPNVLAQFRNWRERNNELEKKFLIALNTHSNRLHLAAALQADVIPQKLPKDPGLMCGGYNLNHYNRDVVRLRILRSQQSSQIKQLQEEINKLRLKPQEEYKREFEPAQAPAEAIPSDIFLYMIPHTPWQSRRKYFPITPLGSQVALYNVNLMKLLYDALDAMKVTRDDSAKLLQDLTALLPAVIAGQRSRYEIVDELLRKWLFKHGGDPSQYKKRTKAFDALAMLSDRLIKEHIEAMEGATTEENNLMDSLEGALKDIANADKLASRLAPSLAALFHTAQSDDMNTEETMTALVNSLIDEEHPITHEDVEAINVANVVNQIRDLGVEVPEEEIERIVLLSIECLRAQLVSEEEAYMIGQEVERSLLSASQGAALIGPRKARVSVERLSKTNLSSRNRSESRSRASSIKSPLEVRKKSRVSLSSKIIILDKIPKSVDTEKEEVQQKEILQKTSVLKQKEVAEKKEDEKQKEDVKQIEDEKQTDEEERQEDEEQTDDEEPDDDEQEDDVQQTKEEKQIDDEKQKEDEQLNEDINKIEDIVQVLVEDIGIDKEDDEGLRETVELGDTKQKDDNVPKEGEEVKSDVQEDVERTQKDEKEEENTE